MVRKKISISLIAILMTLVIVEAVLRVLVQPSKISYGVLFDRELPPLNLMPSDIIADWESKKDLNTFNFIDVDGKKLAFDDIYNIFRDDPNLGFTAIENYVSTNGWRQYNNFGARSRESLDPNKSPNRKRVLFFGESYTSGATIPEEQTFIALLNDKKPNIEFVNFGVDAYSMGQAYLRYETLKDKLNYDLVFLVFVPNVDLWRDISVDRYIGGNWTGYYCYNLPIFIIENRRLKLIPPPYNSVEEFFLDNHDSISARYREHLREYDHYYNTMYEPDYLLGNFVIFKLIRKFTNRVKYEYEKIFGVSEDVMDPHSEAQTVIKGIVAEMAREVQSKGAKFSLIILPTESDIRRYKTDESYKKSWDEMTSFICSGGIVCYDLMKDFSQISVEQLDTGNDGTHYGRKTNAMIADFIIKHAF